MRLPTLQEIDDELARRSLAEFVRQFWDEVEPAFALRWTWHIDAICDHLQAVTEGKIRRLLINVPPGHIKSLLTCVFWPAWEWLERPWLRGLFGSYGYNLAERDSIRCKDLLSGEKYRRLIRRLPDGNPAWSLKELPNRLDEFYTSAGGFRQVISLTGRATGLRGHKVVIDDPINVVDSESTTSLDRANWVIDQSLSSRLIDPATGCHVLIMQRVSKHDPAGHLLEQGGYDHLCLPSEFEGGCACPKGTACSQREGTTIGFVDPRSVPGDLLNPLVFTPDALSEIKLRLGSRGYAGQHQQRPAPLEGNLVKVEYTQRRYQILPNVQGEWRLSCDLKATSSKKKTSSFACVGVWFRPLGSPDCYLVSVYRGRWGFLESISRIRQISDDWPLATKKRIEHKALGPAVVETLGLELTGIDPWDPKTDDKTRRMLAVLPLIEAGNLLLPEKAPWLDEYLAELTTFPASANDDQADMTSMALSDWIRTAAPLAGSFRHAPRRNDGLRKVF